MVPMAAPLCSACSSSGRARRYARTGHTQQPRAEASLGKQDAGCWKPGRDARQRSSTGMALERSPCAEGEKADTEIRMDKTRMGDRPPRRSRTASSPRAMPSGNAPSSARHQANLARESTAGRAVGRSAHGANRLQGTRHCSSGGRSPDDGRPENGRPDPESDSRRDLQGEISEGHSHGEGMLTGLDSVVMVPCRPEILAHIGRRPALAGGWSSRALARVSASAEVVEAPPEFSEGPERIAAGRTAGR